MSYFSATAPSAVGRATPSRPETRARRPRVSLLSFYSQFAEHYEDVFPFRGEVYSFLRDHLRANGQRVLDIGCGTGHYCGRLATDGVEAVGIDLDADMVAAARRRYPRASFVHMDMRDVGALEGLFDLVFCIGNVAAHIDREALGGVISEVARMLDRGGRWVLQTVNWDYVLQHDTYAFRPKVLNGGRLRFLREYRDMTESGVRFLTRLVAENRTVFEGEERLFPIRAAECLALHARPGFEPLCHLADFRGTPFDSAVDSGSVFVFGRRAA